MRQVSNIRLGLSASLLATLLIAIVGWHTGIFWDNVLFVSKMSAPLMEFGPFAWGHIPTIHDPGHPPFIATYLCLVWNVFGRSLAITHLAMYPFIFLFCFMLWKIVTLLFQQRALALFSFVLVLADPTVFCQLMYIGTEVFILCFAGIAIYGILSHSNTYKTIGLMILGITSLRGMMLCFGLFLWDFFIHLWVEKKSLSAFLHPKNIYVYFLGALPAVTYLAWRLISKGWIISNPLNPWGSAWEFASVADFLHNFFRNGIVMAWRILDFGRIVPVVCIASIVWLNRAKLREDKRSMTLLLFCIFSCSIVAGTSLLICNPMGHSYFLLLYIGLALLLISILPYIKRPKWIYSLVLCALLAGNAIIYPDKISQGWPASLASLPHWTLRYEMLEEMDQRGIPRDKVYTFFPMGSCADDVDLSGDTRPYATKKEEAEYILASNIFNPDDDTLADLQHYELVCSRRRCGVWLNLYRITP